MLSSKTRLVHRNYKFYSSIKQIRILPVNVLNNQNQIFESFEIKNNQLIQSDISYQNKLAQDGILNHIISNYSTINSKIRQLTKKKKINIQTLNQQGSPISDSINVEKNEEENKTEPQKRKRQYSSLKAKNNARNFMKKKQREEERRLKGLTIEGNEGGRRNKVKKNEKTLLQILRKERRLSNNQRIRNERKSKVQYRHQYNYHRLILDSYQSVKLLNSLDLSITESSLAIFRSNLFSSENGKVDSIQQIHQLIQNEISKIDENDQNESKLIALMNQQYGSRDIMQLSKDIFLASQIIMEFLDKGMKGILSGDLSLHAIKSIQEVIEKNLPKIENVSSEISNLIAQEQSLKQKFENQQAFHNLYANTKIQTLDDFYEQKFKIDKSKMEQSKIQYEKQDVQFEDSNKALDYFNQRYNIKKHAKVSEEVNFMSSQHSNEMKTNVLLSDFQDLNNVQAILTQDQNKNEGNTEEEQQLDQIKKNMQKQEQKMNLTINNLYDEIAYRLFKLDKFKLPIHGIPDPDKENPMNLFKRQLKIEELSFELAHLKYKQSLNDLIKIGRADQLATSHRYIIRWINVLETCITEQQKIFVKRGSIDKLPNKLGFLLIQLPAEKISALCIMTLVKHLFQQFGDVNKQLDIALELIEKSKEELEYQDRSRMQIPCVQFFLELGNLFDKELKHSAATSGKDQHIQSKNKQHKESNNTVENNQSHSQRQIQQHLLIDDFKIGHIDILQKIKIGAFFSKLMVENLKYMVGQNEQQVLTHSIQRSAVDKQQGFIFFDKGFVEKFISELDKIHDLNLQLENSTPMIYKPAPWKNYYFGGYYLKQTKIAKILPQFQEAVKYMTRSDLSTICSVLNFLGMIEWRVNQRILETIEYIWSTGGGKGEIPLRYNNSQINADKIRKAQFKEKLILLKEHQKNNEQHSLRCDFLLKLNMAISFKSVQKLYFPHCMDFRGRVYPIPPHLNHMGADINRGLLEFSKSKPLGENGLYWLKVHLANKIGQDKLPLDQRAQYTEQIMETVHKCASDPKTNREWLDSENPWQTLSSMIELSAAIKSGDPEKYKSHLHIHVDGSCNGMQHYAAFGRDSNGGRQVNLADSERPGDVYTAILKLVLKEMENDQDPNNKEIIKSLEGVVVRKTIKQTVMTSVYGVTFIGARQQIQKQLKDKKNFQTNGEMYRAAQYLAKVTIKCIGDLFRDANNIKEWFAKCAKIVAETGDPVKWLTPLGLPCVQPYKSISIKNQISTIIQNITVSDDIDEQPVNKSKQNTAFPPNYVHSIDSTHMMLTALSCRDEGIVFAGVHDSYWTHAADVSRMNQILRKQFIQLHSSPLIQNLYSNFISRYPHKNFPVIPQPGDFDLNEVQKSTYFFS